MKKLIIGREDFEEEARVEVFKMFEEYAHNYLVLGIGFAHVRIIKGSFYLILLGVRVFGQPK